MKLRKNRAAKLVDRWRPTLLTLAIAQAMTGDPAAAAVVVVDRLDDGLIGCPLRQAIESANNDQLQADCSRVGSGAIDTIEFDPALSGGTITLANSALPIRSAVSIVGPGADQLTVSGGDNTRIFEVNDNSNDLLPVRIAGLTLTQASSAAGGGAISNSEDLTIVGAIIRDNEAPDGAAIFSSGSQLTVIDSTLSGNTALRGAALYDTRNVTRFVRTTLSRNTATLNGGGATQHYYSEVTFENSLLSSNSAMESGGAIVVENSTILMRDTVVSNNRVQGGVTGAMEGGGIHSVSSELALIDSTISGNQAPSDGGGIYGRDISLALARSRIVNNAASQGGGLFSVNSYLRADTSSISGNSATAVGGGIMHSGNRLLSVNASTLADNQADRGGGLLLDGGASARLFNSTVSGNVATTDGGGIYNFGALRIYASTIAANTATQGGGLYVHAGSVALTESIVGDNQGADCYGTATLSYTLIEDGSCAATLVGDPGLMPLADNGGLTQTHALLPGSPAIDGGEPVLSCGRQDQRGAPRPYDGDGDGVSISDLGAFEFGAQPPPSTPAPMFADGFESQVTAAICMVASE